MTTEDKRGFVTVFNTLAVAVRLTDADVTMQKVYWHGLEDLDFAHVEAAAVTLSRSVQWFPKVSEWRTAAKIAAVASIKALPPGRDTPWTDSCPQCSDCGWEQLTCHGGTRNTCGRKKCSEDGAKDHGYTVPCMCRQTNLVYQRHHLAGNKANYAE